MSYRPSASGGCIVSTAGHRNGFGTDGSSDLNLDSQDDGCPPGTAYNLYVQNLAGGQTVKLNSFALPSPEFYVPDLPAGSGHGRYWFVPVDPVTQLEGTPGPQVIDDERNTGYDTQSVPGEPSLNTQYVHWDHLGSTRSMTYEKGVEIGSWKYYPFGHEAESAGGRDTRMRPQVSSRHRHHERLRRFQIHL